MMNETHKLMLMKQLKKTGDKPGLRRACGDVSGN